MIEAVPVPGLGDALAAHGLIARGGFAFEGREEAPRGPSGRPARSVILVGHGGGTIWPHFTAWLDRQPEWPANPLDAWSREVLEETAPRFGARAVFPFEKPWLPFQQWAMRAEGLRASPLGILMHPEFGLWHAYRGALLFDVEKPVQAADNPIHLCDLCDRKPCLISCPGGAVSAAGMDIARCHGFLASDAGGGCRSSGCAARNACPIATYRYPEVQLDFHMAAHVRGVTRR